METTVVLVVLVVLWAVNRKERMGQVEDLRAAISQVGVDLGEAVSRVEAKIAELGEPDPDLTADIAQLKSVSEQLDNLVSSPAPAPTPDPGPDVDPPGEQPAEF